MITIKYASDGIPVSDMEADEFVQNLLKEEKIAEDKVKFTFEPDVNYETSVSTANVIQAARCLVSKGIDTCIRFKFEDKILYLDRNGMLTEPWPKGFCDYEKNWCGRLLKGCNKW